MKAGIGFKELLPAEQPLREGARQRRRMDPRGGLKTNVKRSISRACHFERSERSLPFAVRDSRFPHMCRALLRFSHLSFIPLEPYPARFARHLPHAGKALSVVILFPHMHVFALTVREKRHPRFFIRPTQKRPSLTSGRFYMYYLLRETLIKSQNSISHVFSCNASSYSSLNSSLFASEYSLHCMKI